MTNQQTIKFLEDSLNDLIKQHNEMNKTINDISRVLRELKQGIPSTGGHPPASGFKNVHTAAFPKVDANSSHIIKSPNAANNPISARRPTANSLGNSIILAEYRNLFNYTGNDAKNARDNFVKKYNVIGIACKNFEERVNSPSVAPVFETTASLAKAHIWAIDTKQGSYLAFFNPSLGYDEQIHEYGGMKYVFDSNYRSGVYNRFNLTQVAQLRNNGGVWTVVRKGRIEV